MKPKENELRYIETDGDWEYWEHPKTGKIYRVSYSIERDFENMEVYKETKKIEVELNSDQRLLKLTHEQLTRIDIALTYLHRAKIDLANNGIASDHERKLILANAKSYCNLAADIADGQFDV